MTRSDFSDHFTLLLGESDMPKGGSFSSVDGDSEDFVFFNIDFEGEPGEDDVELEGMYELDVEVLTKERKEFRPVGGRGTYTVAQVV